MQGLKVELLGMWPEFFQMCPTRTDLIEACNLEPAREQLQDYPPEVRANGLVLQSLYARLMEDFAGRVIPVSVGYASLRGAWLSLRFRLRQDPVVVVGGKAVPVSAGYGAVKAAVTEALSLAS